MSATDNLQDAVQVFTRAWLIERLIEHGGSRRETARAIGMSRTYLQALINKHGIGSEDGVGLGRPGARPGQRRQVQHCGWCGAVGHNSRLCPARGSSRRRP